MIATPKGFSTWSPTNSKYEINHGDQLIIITFSGHMQRVIASRLDANSGSPYRFFEFVNPDTKNVVLGLDHEKILFFKKEVRQ